jgi:hypothetical protein
MQNPKKLITIYEKPNPSDSNMIPERKRKSQTNETVSEGFILITLKEKRI